MSVVIATGAPSSGETFLPEADDGYEPSLLRSACALPILGIGAYIVTSMFYVFPSGAPQPADVILLACIPIALLLSGLSIPYQPLIYVTLGLFVTWVTLVNVSWFLLQGDYLFLKKTSFYFYNSLVFVLVLMVGARDMRQLALVVRWACIAALIMEVLYLTLVHSHGGASQRATGSSNNPNQLAYWALLAMACMAIAKERVRLGFADLLGVVCGAYVIALSLSKAAFIAGSLLVATISITCGWRRGVWLVLAAIITLGLTLEVARGGLGAEITEMNFISHLEKRLSGIGEQKDDFLLHRGYIRLLRNPQYLVLGAGEGAFERLTDEAFDKEFHSTLGNVLMSYGILGLGILVGLLFLIFWYADITAVSCFVTIMIYGITHNGLRETLFWIFLALVFAQSIAARTPVAFVAPGTGRHA